MGWQPMSFVFCYLVCLIRVCQSFPVVVLAGNKYWINETAETGTPAGHGHDLIPCTVVDIDVAHNGSSALKDKLHHFGQVDDVWSPAFLSIIVVQVTQAEPEGLQQVQSILGDTETLEDNATFYTHCVRPGASRYPERPYFLHKEKLHATHRLYPDTADAFVVSTVPTGAKSSYKSLDVSAWGEDHPSSLTIAVPSRLYYTKSAEQPFAGVRVGIKDIIDLKGLKTGASSRTYTTLYGRSTSNAPIVQRLIDLGFVIVGKTRTTQFADSEWPTADWVDYHAPWNPRGEGYQVPCGSSSGSAAGLATYPWLDVAIGTDTGSVRAPAAVQGLYGIRPSTGATSMDGIVPYSSLFDSLGVFTRNASMLADLVGALYAAPTTKSCEKYPTRLLYPKQHWPVDLGESQAIFEAFISQLEEHQRAVKIAAPISTNLIFEEFFEYTFHKAAHKDQAEFLGKVVADWKASHEGKMPIFNPQLQYKLNTLFPSLTEADHAEGLQELQIFRQWFETSIIPPANDRCPDTVMVLPWTHGQPDYRDTYREPPHFSDKGFFFWNWSPYAGVPEIVIPIGQTKYHSRLSNSTEYLPVAIGVVGAKGSDAMLADLVKIFMAWKGDTGAMKTGSTAFDVDGKVEEAMYRAGMETLDYRSEL